MASWGTRAFAIAIFALGISQAQAAPPAGAPAVAPSAHALTQGDLEPFLDGMMPVALERASIAGAVVAVVKDRHVLFEKGYGYSDVDARRAVDPTRTMFRPGSISKLFTWTAVMQLQEQGRLDLDKDINTYLDFRIPDAFGKPITLRNIMTHTTGFEETVKNLMADNPKMLRTLQHSLMDWIPERMYAPGEVPSYSNYGAALAGYIVQRVSGEPFEQYIARHIFRPLAMNHSTFVQPLPKQFETDMSKGYVSASGKPKAFELISMSPAGGLSASADDLARFMMAHLNDGSYEGAQILKPETAQLMHKTALQLVQGVPGMALGFYHEDRNGHDIIGHGGDTQWFHSDMHLILDENVGLLISMNSAGNESLVTSVRKEFFDGIMDRYFPAPPAANTPALPSAKADAEKIAGSYYLSRRSDSNFAVIASLGQQLPVQANADGTISAPALVDKNGIARKFREIAPNRWREVNGPNVFVVVKDGEQVRYVTSDIFPQIFVLHRVPFYRNLYWVGALLGGSALMLLLTVLFWPIKAILRWRYSQPLSLSGRALTYYRLARVAALIDVVWLAGWATFFVLASLSLSYLDVATDPYLRALQVLGLVGVVATIFPIANFWLALKEARRPWWTRVTDGLVALAAIIVVYYSVALHLFSVGLNY
jgi:CubicO group peptidase (beta-lactamase class C family)